MINIKNINASNLLICQVKNTAPVKRMLVNKRKGKSCLTNLGSTFIVATSEHKPSINSMLNMLLPTTLLIAIAYITMYAFAFATLLLVVAVVCATLYKLYKQISDKLR